MVPRQAYLDLGAPVLKRLGRAWRTGATLLCFGVFMGGSFLALPLAAPLLALAPDRPWRRSLGKALVRLFFRFFIGFMRVLGVLDLEAQGCAALRGRRGCFIVANHPTLIDFVLLASLVPGADCLVKSSLTRHWAMRWPVLLAGYIPNDRGEETLELCRRSLGRGNSLVVFAEGTRTPSGRLPILRRGAAQLAVRCSRSVTQVVLDCPDSNLEKGGVWWLAPPGRMRMRAWVLEPLETAPFLERAGGRATLAARTLTALLQRRFHEVLTHA